MTTQSKISARGSSDVAEQKLGLLRDERGLSTVEYIILMVIIVVGCIGVWNSIGEDVKGHLDSSQTAIQDIGQGSGN